MGSFKCMERFEIVGVEVSEAERDRALSLLRQKEEKAEV